MLILGGGMPSLRCLLPTRKDPAETCGEWCPPGADLPKEPHGSAPLRTMSSRRFASSEG